jgi:nucleoside-diphosphate-sugar epimerase
MRSVLVLGATGFIGAAVCERLLHVEGYTVTGTVRSADGKLPKGEERQDGRMDRQTYKLVILLLQRGRQEWKKDERMDQSLHFATTAA